MNFGLNLLFGSAIGLSSILAIAFTIIILCVIAVFLVKKALSPTNQADFNPEIYDKKMS